MPIYGFFDFSLLSLHIFACRYAASLSSACFHFTFLHVDTQLLWAQLASTSHFCMSIRGFFELSLLSLHIFACRYAASLISACLHFTFLHVDTRLPWFLLASTSLFCMLIRNSFDFNLLSPTTKHTIAPSQHTGHASYSKRAGINTTDVPKNRNPVSITAEGMLLHLTEVVILSGLRQFEPRVVLPPIPSIYR